jgi:uncharacterized protein YkwD
MRLPLVAALAAALLSFAGTARAADDPYASLLAPSGTCGPADGQPNLDQHAAQLVMVCLTNYARAQSGLQPLQPSTMLDSAGNAKLAADLSCGVFSHEPCGQPFDAVFSTYTQGASSYQIGENIAWGTGSFGTPRQIMNAWLHSSGHRENILTAAFTQLGIGYAPNQAFLGYGGAALWSQEFGARTPLAPATATSPVTQPDAAKKSVVKKTVAKKRRASHRKLRRHRPR